MARKEPALVAPAATTPAAVAAAAAATPAAVAAAAAAARLAAAAAVGLGPGLVDRQLAAARLLAVQGGDGRLGLLVRLHLDEPEPLGPAGVPVHDHLGRLDRAVGGEHLLQVAVGHVVVEVPDVQLLTHQTTPVKKRH